MAIVVLSVIPASDMPTTGTSRGFEHLFIFLATATAFGVGYPNRFPILAVLLVLFTGAVELVQAGIPGRHARLSDFLLDAAATCAGIAISWIIVKLVAVAQRSMVKIHPRAAANTARTASSHIERPSRADRPPL
jgi:hypothetical protein